MANFRNHRGGYRPLYHRVLPGCFVPPPPTPPALPSWMVVDQRVRLGDHPPHGLDPQEWGTIKCSTKTAYGCGEHGQKVLDGLSLHIRLVKPQCITTALFIHVNDEAAEGILAEFDLGSKLAKFGLVGDGPPTRIDGDEFRASGVITATTDDIIVLAVVFTLHRFYRRIYYLVYNASAESLSMIPAPPDPACEIGCTPKPLVVIPRHDHGGEGFELVFMSEKLLPPPRGQGYNTYQDVLYRWTPGSESSLSSDDEGPWMVQERRFPPGIDDFVVETMFTLDGKAFFCDLAKGFVYCDQSDSSSTVDFKFIPLPADAPPDNRWAKVDPQDMGPINWYRTMGCVGGSVKFVCIDRSAARPEDVKVILFTLDLPQMKWTKNKELRTVELWKFLGFQKRKLPETVPKCPVLMKDNTLSLLLPNMRRKKEDPIEDYMCNFRMEADRVKLNWDAHLDGCYYSEPIILSSGFFEAIVPPNNVKPRKTIFL